MLGPLVSAAARDRVLDLVGAAELAGAKITVDSVVRVGGWNASRFGGQHMAGTEGYRFYTQRADKEA
ncbi:hypothetical protein [Amycolatopsis pithecellobii]|uniref:Uncharacterized protein n=1 Tax=Amycolatopsis pithecellobii TaxID=664692 RepID=A0A6N7Z2A0_9PSEU|nr:hypothetical protein [Amycolatopsis pithecellobii]MTD55733.1 hypothetical protein [Amycolatopsis pithecellobii]